jgi:hypothetical protein
MQLLQSVIDGSALLKEVLGESNFPVDLAEPGFDIVSHRKPLGADKVEESLERYVGGLSWVL